MSRTVVVENCMICLFMSKGSKTRCPHFHPRPPDYLTTTQLGSREHIQLFLQSYFAGLKDNTLDRYFHIAGSKDNPLDRYFHGNQTHFHYLSKTLTNHLIRFPP
eukprot:15365773-Ditylum_brightwellii.AAC.1